MTVTVTATKDETRAGGASSGSAHHIEIATMGATGRSSGGGMMTGGVVTMTTGEAGATETIGGEATDTMVEGEAGVTTVTRGVNRVDTSTVGTMGGSERHLGSGRHHGHHHRRRSSLGWRTPHRCSLQAAPTSKC